MLAWEAQFQLAGCPLSPSPFPRSPCHRGRQHLSPGPAPDHSQLPPGPLQPCVRPRASHCSASNALSNESIGDETTGEKKAAQRTVPALPRRWSQTRKAVAMSQVLDQQRLSSSSYGSMKEAPCLRQGSLPRGGGI